MKDPAKQKASSLVTTLLVIVVLSTIVVAFLQSMSIERLTAQSYANRFRAENAVQSGLNYAISLIGNLTTNYTYNVIQVTTNDQNYLFIGNAVGGASTNIVYTPLFSGGLAQTNGVAALPVVALDSGLIVSSNRPILPLPLKSPVISWIELPLTNGGKVASLRFCFTAGDLEGGLNLGSVGNTNAIGGLHSRATNNSPEALALYTLFSTNSQKDPGATLAAQIIKQRATLLSSDSVLQIDPSQTNNLDAMFMNVGTYVERDTIPIGFQYQDEGDQKFDINATISGLNTSAVDGFTKVIQDNLPQFETIRKGGFNRGSYLKTISANLVDYVDTNNNPTVGSDYRGVDSYPLVNLIFSRIAWVSGVGTTGSPVSIQVRTFVNLWNPSSQTAAGTIDLEMVNGNGLIVGGLQNFSTETFPSFNVSIPPNGHAVVEAGSRTYSFVNGTGALPVASPLVWKNMTSDYSTTFRLRWNGLLVDEFRGGARRLGSETGSFLPSGDAQRRYQGNAAHLNYTDGQVGDPRSSFYINTFAFDRSYDDSTAWGGRQFSSSISNPAFKEVRFSRWPDPSNDGPAYPLVTSEIASGNDAVQAAAESPLPSSTSPWFMPNNGRGTWRGFGNGTLPTAIQLPPALTNLSPARIVNSGTVTNICELGNIFDPAQWQNITSSSPVASANAGGGFTLRIGQQDFPKFSTNGARASQLLDLFTVNTNQTNRGKVNLNTAPVAVLRALAAGILHPTNENLQPTNIEIYPARSASGAAADRFAEAVIASRPFLSISQLSHSTNLLGGYFGNTNQWGNTNEAPTMWNDSSREYLFSQILPLVSVRSRNFRMFICGQALDKKGRVVSSMNAVFHVFFEPVENGTKISVKPNVLYVKKF